MPCADPGGEHEATGIYRVLGGATARGRRGTREQPTMPIIGYFNSQTPDTYADRLRAFQRGLKDAGYVEGENVAIVYRWGEN